MLIKDFTLFSLSFSGNKMKRNKKYHNVRTILKSGISATYTPLSEQFQNPIHLFTFISTISMQHPENKVLCSVIFYRVIHKTSLTSSLFMIEHIPSQGSERSCI